MPEEFSIGAAGLRVGPLPLLYRAGEVLSNAMNDCS
jgi:hypothetical protein